MYKEKKRIMEMEKHLDMNYCLAQNIDYTRTFMDYIKETRTNEEMIEKLKIIRLAYELNEKKQQSAD